MDELFDPKRHLGLEEAHNVRDLGGYKTRSGGVTQWGRFLRADTMHRLTEADQAALLDYGVRTVVDLRRTDETVAEPDVFAQSAAVAFHHLNMIGDEILEVGRVIVDPARRIAHDYCGWLDQYQEMMGRILGTLAAGPLVALYHCAAGKDRTGVVSALLLGLVGVPEETIVADYSLTARCAIEDYRKTPTANPAILTWEDYQRDFCPPETMQMVLDHLVQSYGGSEGYMRTVGLGEEAIGRLRDSLLV
jgi:protein-tyrosine phosphatase